MEVPNKWRGKRLVNGEYVSGVLFKNSVGALINDGSGYVQVDPKSLSKLAGYDEEGNEVYRSSKR